MNTLITPLEDFAIGEKTTLSADIAASIAVLPANNVAGFAANDFVIVGLVGSETSQLRQISSITDQNITLTVALSFLHAKDTPVTKVLYDKRKFYRSTTKTGTYSHLSAEGSPIPITVDSPEGTRFDDSSGTSTSWYKSTYYNSTTLSETPIADSVPAQAGEGTDYTTIFKIRQEAGFENQDYISSELINRYREEAQMQVDGALAIAYSTPFSSIPKLVTHITTLLAAGLLLAKEYGVEADVDVSKTGQRKIDRAEALLKKIIDGEILLIDSTGTLISKNSTILASGSNEYNSDGSKGELFNRADENFKFTDPDEPTSSSARLADGTLLTKQWSQR